MGLIIPVLGAYRSGSSCVAGILHKLGIFMGTKLTRRQGRIPRGVYEPKWLGEQLKTMWDERSLWCGKPQNIWPSNKRINVLKEWINSALAKRNIAGFKHPLLCLSINDIIMASDGHDIKAIRLLRNVDDSVASSRHVGFARNGNACRACICKLIDIRDSAISNIEHFDINYDNLINEPHVVIAELINFIGINPCFQRFEKAIKHVDRRLRHFSGGCKRKKILVQQKGYGRAGYAKKLLDKIYTTCKRELNIPVVRWKIGNSVPNGITHAFLWNGMHPIYHKCKKQLGTAKIFYAEMGWFPHLDSYQIDCGGINAAASWASEPVYADGDRLNVSGDKLLVLLQDPRDTQVKAAMSPWITMVGMLEHLCAYSRMKVVVRRHPWVDPGSLVIALMQRYRLNFDCSENLKEAAHRYRAFATINSSAAVELMHYGMPILCYGKAVYRHEYAAYCMHGDPAETAAVTDQLSNGECFLLSGSMSAVVDRIRSHQIALKNIDTQYLLELCH